jgi:glycosyltransferase involved in cell wall biosynthesis
VSGSVGNTGRLIVGMPGVLRAPEDGISRAIYELNQRWRGRVDLRPVALRSVNLPLVRSWPWTLAVPGNVDVVLLPQIMGASALWGYRGRPTVVMVHDLGCRDLPADRQELGLAGQLGLYPNVLAISRATRIVTPSEFTRNRLLHHLTAIPPERVSVIPLGVSETFLNVNMTRREGRMWLQQSLGVGTGGSLLTYVGQEAPRKNLPLLWQSLSALKRFYPDATLITVGKAGKPEWRRATLEALRRQCLTPGRDVIFLDHVSDESLARIYRASDVAVSPSVYEGFGLPLLEAIAVGTPTLTVRGGVPDEVLNPDAARVEPTAEAMMRAIKSLVEQDGLRGEEERRQWGRRFTWRRAADDWIAMLYRLAAEPPNYGSATPMPS